MAQIVAIVIFIAMFALIVWDKIERQYITLGCAALTLILVFGVCMHDPDAAIRTLNVQEIFTKGFWIAASESSESSSGINWATIIFIAGMMIMVEGMGRAGFFRWLCMRMAKLVDYKPVRLLIAFMLMSFVLAMFIDSITVILFLAAITIELAKMLEFNPTSLIMAEIFCANLGGSATMSGDPPNIIIGTSLHYTFGDFVTNTGIMALISLVFVLIYVYLTNHKALEAEIVSQEKIAQMPDPKSTIENQRDFVISCLIFACAVVMLITHAQTGLTVAFIGVFIAAITLITSGKYAGWLLKKLDYKTLLFFIGLFVVVGGLEETGVLEQIVKLIEVICGDNYALMIAVIIWISAIASAFIDNIPFAATMIPVIRSLSVSTGVALPTLAWALSMGTDIGGSATPIGASANVVGISICAKSGHVISWSEYCKHAVPATVITLLICTAYIILFYL